MIKAGSTPGFYFRIKDDDGNQLDPESATAVIEFKAIIYNAISDVASAKFVLNETPLPSGYTRALVKDLGGGDKRVAIYLTAAQTLALAQEGNNNKIQVEVTYYDTDYDSNSKIVVKTGKFPEVELSNS